MRPFALYRGSVYLFGSRFPAAVVAIFALTLLLTLVGVVGMRNGLPLLEYAALIPGAVLRGQVWRLFTWFFFDPRIDPLSLLFWGMALLMFGRDLCDAWGWRRFVAVYLGIGAAAGLLTCVTALVWPSLLGAVYMASWPLAGALVLAWAFLFPTRQILFNFVIPVSGSALAWITVAVAVFFALLYGIGPALPHLAALAAMYLYIQGVPLLQRQWMGARLRKLQGPARRRPGHLRPVDEPDEKPRWYH
jgi:membrane associated rhomboid family serine protease